jgi:predicted transcriptional regulator
MAHIATWNIRHNDKNYKIGEEVPVSIGKEAIQRLIDLGMVEDDEKNTAKPAE